MNHNRTQTTKVLCYLTDCPISVEDARRLVLSDGARPVPSTTQVFAHKDVLAFLVARGEVQQLGAAYIAFV
jgi:hypothetical protein